MSLVSVNWHPSPKELNSFRWISVLITLVLAVVLHVVRDVGLTWCAVIAGIGLVIGLSGFISLRLTRIFYVTLVAVTLPIGMIISFIFMAVFYFGLITPVGLFFRCIGRDSMKRRWDTKAETYWIEHKPPQNLERYFRPF
jgi:hypothetical protein